MPIEDVLVASGLLQMAIAMLLVMIPKLGMTAFLPQNEKISDDDDDTAGYKADVDSIDAGHDESTGSDVIANVNVNVNVNADADADADVDVDVDAVDVDNGDDDYDA